MTLKNRFTTVEASPVKIYLDYRQGTRKVSYNYPNELSTYHRARSYPAVVAFVAWKRLRNNNECLYMHHIQLIMSRG